MGADVPLNHILGLGATGEAPPNVLINGTRMTRAGEVAHGLRYAINPGLILGTAWGDP